MTVGCGNRPTSVRPIMLGVRRAGGYVVVAVLGTTAAYHLRDQLPQPSDVIAVLRAADTTWLIAASLAILISLDMFARHQRTLLAGIGVTLPHRHALALAYSRAAMAYSLPAGSVVSATYAYRQFHAHGADRRAAAMVLTLSGVLLATALAMIYAAGVIAAALLNLPLDRMLPPQVTTTATASAGVLLVIATIVIKLAARSVTSRYWMPALTAALANWSTELLCLLFVTRALGLEIGIIPLAAMFLGAQLARQIPLTPGGIGLIEASLITGLISAGTPATTAAATVLVYRLLSCWLVINIGLLSWLYLRKRTRTSPNTHLPT
ncbi:lysylphosphatidylglycerol synthase transmembrane domain-containing protein [Haloechinothrix halophila]|uniref:lysylphosphatidylglycerol synthase transmembrane domain-containing protein n=1 Tax=Haloechinothrix halophila TaxID=1069073 RepID=UPI000412882B|nr:YbhN family protein [Haloechinothrix halophila]